MTQHIAFQMEPLGSIAEPSRNNSFLLLAEAFRRGHTLYQYEPNALTCDQGAIRAKGERVTSVDPIRTEAAEIELGRMDMVHVRQDPPFNMEYITALYLLQQLPAQVRVVNDPGAILAYPEKIFPLEFPDYVPPTVITRDREELEAFYQAHQNIVVKPLYGFHGHGIFHLKEGDDNLAAIIEHLIDQAKEPLIAQTFIPEITTEGNTRALFIDGAMVGAFRIVPEKGEFRLYRGSQNVKHTLTEREQAICDALGPKLKERGLFFVGIDIIGGYLIEVNTTSTGSIDKYNALYGETLEAVFWDRLKK